MRRERPFRRRAFSESILSDFKDLRPDSRVTVTPNQSLDLRARAGRTFSSATQSLQCVGRLFLHLRVTERATGGAAAISTELRNIYGFHPKITQDVFTWHYDYLPIQIIPSLVKRRHRLTICVS
jgi:hypothetical protein